MKKTIIKYLLRLLGLTIITLILLFILNIIFAFNGNPIQASQAERNIKKYVNKKFDISQYTLSDILYLFKPNKYFIQLENKSIKDDHFNIYYDPASKNIDASEYEKNVLSKKNTIERLEQEYENAVSKILYNNFIDEELKKIKEIKVTFNNGTNIKLNELNLDATLEDIMVYPVHLTLNIDQTITNNFDVAVLIRMMKKIFIDNSIIVDSYTLKFDSTFSSVRYLEITSEEIAIKNLDEILNRYISDTESTRKELTNA